MESVERPGEKYRVVSLPSNGMTVGAKPLGGGCTIFAPWNHWSKIATTVGNADGNGVRGDEVLARLGNCSLAYSPETKEYYLYDGDGNGRLMEDIMGTSFSLSRKRLGEERVL